MASKDVGRVETSADRRDGRLMRRHSEQMEELLSSAIEQCAVDSAGTLEGVLYTMLRPDADGGVVPLYIGRAGVVGHGGGISVNMESIRSNTSRFARR